MTRRRLLEEHDAGEIAEWQAFDALEPFGPDATDIRYGRLTQILANAYRGKDARPFTLEDTMLAARPAPAPADLTEKALRAFGIQR